MRTRNTRIRPNGSYCVEYMTQDVYDSRPIRRTFIVSTNGGYVYELTDTGRMQVCDGLANMGPTLYLENGEGLLDMIRHEHRVMLRDLARYC